MISIARRKCGLQIQEVFFSDNPTRNQGSALIRYFVQAACPAPGFYPFKTQIIDLESTIDSLFAGVSSGARYKIRRAEREGITPATSTTPEAPEVSEFGDFYDEFARQKNLPSVNRRKLRALRKVGALMITTARDTDNSVLAAHAYVADASIGRIRLLYSASHFRGTTDTEARNRTGRANRLLHWHEITDFKNHGFRHYDLGGVPIDNRDPVKNAIARFKSEFGGRHVIEFNGYTTPVPMLNRCIPLMRRPYR